MSREARRSISGDWKGCSQVVRAKLQYYYTFKAVGDIIQCHKWEEATGEHADMYKVTPNTDWHGCTCAAWKKCKHQRCVEEAILDGRIRELWRWRWDEKQGWTELKDIQPIQELM